METCDYAERAQGIQDKLYEAAFVTPDKELRDWIKTNKSPFVSQNEKPAKVPNTHENAAHASVNALETYSSMVKEKDIFIEIKSVVAEKYGDEEFDRDLTMLMNEVASVEVNGENQGTREQNGITEQSEDDIETKKQVQMAQDLIIQGMSMGFGTDSEVEDCENVVEVAEVKGSEDKDLEEQRGSKEIKVEEQDEAASVNSVQVEVGSREDATSTQKQETDKEVLMEVAETLSIKDWIEIAKEGKELILIAVVLGLSLMLNESYRTHEILTRYLMIFTVALALENAPEGSMAAMSGQLRRVLKYNILTVCTIFLMSGCVNEKNNAHSLAIICYHVCLLMMFQDVTIIYREKIMAARKPKFKSPNKSKRGRMHEEERMAHVNTLKVEYTTIKVDDKTMTHLPRSPGRGKLIRNLTERQNHEIPISSSRPYIEMGLENGK